MSNRSGSTPPICAQRGRAIAHGNPTRSAPLKEAPENCIRRSEPRDKLPREPRTEKRKPGAAGVSRLPDLALWTASETRRPNSHPSHAANRRKRSVRGAPSDRRPRTRRARAEARAKHRLAHANRAQSGTAPRRRGRSTSESSSQPAAYGPPKQATCKNCQAVRPSRIIGGLCWHVKSSKTGRMRTLPAGSRRPLAALFVLAASFRSHPRWQSCLSALAVACHTWPRTERQTRLLSRDGTRSIANRGARVPGTSPPWP